MAKSDVTPAVSMCLHPGINCRTLLVIYSPAAILSSRALGYFCCDTRARCAHTICSTGSSCVVCADPTATRSAACRGNRACSLLWPPGNYVVIGRKAQTGILGW